MLASAKELPSCAHSGMLSSLDLPVVVVVFGSGGAVVVDCAAAVVFDQSPCRPSIVSSQSASPGLIVLSGTLVPHTSSGSTHAFASSS